MGEESYGTGVTQQPSAVTAQLHPNKTPVSPLPPTGWQCLANKHWCMCWGQGKSTSQNATGCSCSKRLHTTRANQAKQKVRLAFCNTGYKHAAATASTQLHVVAPYSGAQGHMLSCMRTHISHRRRGLLCCVAVRLVGLPLYLQRPAEELSARGASQPCKQTTSITRVPQKRSSSSEQQLQGQAATHCPSRQGAAPLAGAEQRLE